jgi:hypothetical protein
MIRSRWRKDGGVAWQLTGDLRKRDLCKQDKLAKPLLLANGVIPFAGNMDFFAYGRARLTL